MKIKTHYFLFVLALAISISACKTKKEMAEESQFQDIIDARSAESKLLLDQSGLDPAAAETLAETLKSLDLELMNFLATDPSVDARRATLKRLMAERNQKLQGSMTDEQYAKYIEAQRILSEEKNKKIGAPAKDSGR